MLVVSVRNACRRMGMRVRLSVIGRVVVGAVLLDNELGGRYVRPQDALRRDGGTIDCQAPQRRPQLLEREPRVEQRAQHHVAGRTVETVEV